MRSKVGRKRGVGRGRGGGRGEAVYPAPLSVFSFCRYYADIIVGLLQDVALQATIHPYVEPDAAQFDVPPPMFDNNLEIATKCLRGDLLQQRVYQSVVSAPAKHVQCLCNY